jgi:predicted O-methyltransferase YrrM
MINVQKYREEYNDLMKKVRSLGQPESTGGMTGWPGQFLYAAVRTLKPQSGLEVGTRNGMSAAIAAGAMQKNGVGKLLTLDIVNVLNYEARPTSHDCVFTMNPKEIQDAIGIEPGTTTFLKQRSTDFMGEALWAGMKYDYILLDGSHNEDEVYAEIGFACELVTRNGIIIFDDVYPENSPLPQHKHVIRGPWAALERRKKEGFIPNYTIPNPNTTVAYILGAELC